MENQIKNIFKKTNVYKYYLLMLFPFSLAFLLRLAVINEYGLHGDEVNKAHAVQHYRNFDFSYNSEHPALTKFAMTLSTIIFGEGEFALRFPNVFVAALTVYPIFLIGRELYDELIGYLASILWAVNITTIAFSTMAKEDTFLTFFWAWVIFFFIKAKDDPKYYRHLGISLGLAIASKYTAIMLAFVLLVLQYSRCKDNTSCLSIKRILSLIVPSAIFTFILANFPIFFPSTIMNLFDYFILHKRLYPPHSGFYSMGQIISKRPPYQLVLHIFVKNTLPYLMILFTGLIFTTKDRSEADKILLIWILIPLSIFSIVFRIPRWYHIIEPAFMLIATNGVRRFSIYLTLKIHRINIKLNLRISNLIAISLVMLVCINSLFVYAITFPYHRMYVNELGGGSDKAGYYFPGESVYDYYFREAIFYVNENAPLNAVIAINEIRVGEYYGRPDLKFVFMWDLPINLTRWSESNVSFAIVQNSRNYYENIEIQENIRTSFIQVKNFQIGKNTVIEIYSI